MKSFINEPEIFERYGKKFTNKYGIPLRIVDFIIKCAFQYDLTERDSNTISVTELLEVPYIRHLKVTLPHEEVYEVRNLQDAVMGNMAHYCLESIKKLDPTCVSFEERLEINIEGMNVSGKYDFLELIAIGSNGKRLIDFKTMNVWALNDKKKLLRYFSQVNIYRYLLKKAKNIDIEKAELFICFKAWQASDYERNPDSYPACAYEIVPVPLWTMEETEQFIKERIKAHKELMNTPCTSEEMWSDPDVLYCVTDPSEKGFKGKSPKSKKNCSTKEEAEQWIEEKGKQGISYSIVERKPYRIRYRCSTWCTMANGCPSYQAWLNKEK